MLINISIAILTIVVVSVVVWLITKLGKWFDRLGDLSFSKSNWIAFWLGLGLLIIVVMLLDTLNTFGHFIRSLF